MTLPSGTRLGSYELTTPIGAGGMGEVYRARDARLGREAAVVTVSTGRVTFLPGYSEGSYILDYPSWSRDGKKVYFSVARKSGDVYVLEGF
jgi:serine/threonine protein kinase